jgi:hypothetical protein
VTIVGLGGVFEQATAASARKKIEPIQAIRPVRTLALPNHLYRSRTVTPHPPLLLCGRQAPFQGPACPAAGGCPTRP